jgi:outer membrane protein assembly factor BamB
VYAYDASSGKLDWAVQTGAYVYSSPAVANAPGLGPTIYIGSYDGTFRAIDARSGAVEWTYDAGGKISGSATIVGNVVYFSDLATHRTIGLGISTGKQVYSLDSGSFDPVISDGHNLYVSGYSALFGFAPVSATHVPTSRAPASRASASKTPANKAPAARAPAKSVMTKGATAKSGFARAPARHAQR